MYDAFISYSHEDEAVAIWLEAYLSSAWVPGHSRRQIFRDESQLTAGGLSETLKRNLKESRFLVVCCSSAAARSYWVNLEIDEFAHAHATGPSHATSAVLACQVGQPGTPISLPPALRWIQRELDDQLYLPDLRGLSVPASQKRDRKARLEAAALLAPIVGLASREEVIARIRKRRIQLSITAAATSVLVLMTLFLWNRWLGTPEGYFYSAAEMVLSTAGRMEIVSPELIAAARALGAQNQRDRITTLSQFVHEKQFRSIVMAAGLASLPHPDCTSADALLRDVDHAAASTWPDGHLLTFRACGGPWLDRARTTDLAPELKPAWFEHLVRTGNLPQARQLLGDSDYPKADVLPALAELAIAFRVSTAFSQSEFLHWANSASEGADAADVLYRGLALLRRYDLANRLADPLPRQLGTICFQAASTRDINIADSWTNFGQLAAHLAGIGMVQQAETLLSLKRQHEPNGDPGWAPGWIWRGLAYQRLQNSVLAKSSFAQGEACLRAEVPASRDFREVEGVATTYVLANDWPAAFGAIARSGNEQVQVLQRCTLLGLWVDRRGSVPWPWRIENRLVGK